MLIPLLTIKIFLLNDTATVPHIGCQAVSDAHARLLGGLGHHVVDRVFIGELRAFATMDEKSGIAAVLSDDVLRSRIEACDALVVNGEGTLHHGFGSEYFACVWAAQHVGKVTLIINAVFEAHTGWKKRLESLMTSAYEMRNLFFMPKVMAFLLVLFLIRFLPQNLKIMLYSV